MKINREQKIEVYLLTEIKGIEPVTVYVTNYKLGQGKMVIECFGDSWAYYWGSMGEVILQNFVLSASNDYLASKLVKETRQTDFDRIQSDAKKRGFDICAANDVEIAMQASEMSECFGSDWYMDLPQCETSEYKYVCRILSAIKEAFILEAKA